jgi:two-component system response regulator FixJ
MMKTPDSMKPDASRGGLAASPAEPHEAGASRDGRGRRPDPGDPPTRQGAPKPRRTDGVCRTLYLISRDPALHATVAGLPARDTYSLVPFAGAASLLAAVRAFDTGVLILDMEGQERDALEVLDALGARDFGLKVICLSAKGGVRLSVQALRAGAVDFLKKPCRTGPLLESLELAFRCAEAEAAGRQQRETLQRRCECLTPRERQVMRYVVRGVPNRRVAARLGVSERTVELHRARVMTKMAAASLPELVRMADFCDRDRASDRVSRGSGGLDLMGGLPQ